MLTVQSRNSLFLMPNRDTFSRGELRERRNRWKHTQKSIIPLALITQNSKGVDRIVEEKTPKTLRIKIEKKKKIEDVS